MTNRNPRNTHTDDAWLAALLADQAAHAEPDAALLARIVADAERIQAGFAAPPSPARAAPVRGRRRAIVFGWPALGWAGGLAASLGLGLWIGATASQTLVEAFGASRTAASVETLADAADGSDDIYGAILALDLEG